MLPINHERSLLWFYLCKCSFLFLRFLDGRFNLGDSLFLIMRLKICWERDSGGESEEIEFALEITVGIESSQLMLR